MYTIRTSVNLIAKINGYFDGEHMSLKTDVSLNIVDNDVMKHEQIFLFTQIS